MKSVRKQIGGIGNLMFKEAFILGKMLDGEIPDQYLQSEKYWHRHADAIKATFSAGIVKNDKVAIHIRRGDYVDNPFYVDLWKTDYYKKAIEMFPNDKFIVFCKDNQGWEGDKSDRQWCRSNLSKMIPYDRFELPAKENTEEEDLNLMAGCKSIIMANSSFSWWASFIGQHAKVICPKLWFADGIQRCDPLPQWILI